MLKRSIPCVCGLALILTACSKHTEAPPKASSQETQPSSTAPSESVAPPRPAPSAQSAASARAPAQAAPAAPTAITGDSTVPLGELTQALRKYSAEHQRVPTSFSEVVAAGYVKGTPTPPPGKKFSINAKRVEVVLVNQ